MPELRAALRAGAHDNANRSRTWTVETFGPVVDAEIASLPKDMQAAFLRLAERVEAVGLERIGAPHVKPLQGKLWEMRLNGGLSRVWGDQATFANCWHGSGSNSRPNPLPSAPL